MPNGDVPGPADDVWRRPAGADRLAPPRPAPVGAPAASAVGVDVAPPAGRVVGPSGHVVVASRRDHPDGSAGPDSAVPADLRRPAGHHDAAAGLATGHRARRTTARSASAAA